MPKQTVFLFDLTKRIAGTIRDLKMQDIMQKKNKMQIESFGALLSDVGAQVETCKSLFPSFQNIPDPQVAMAKDYETACQEGVKRLKGTLAKIEKKNSGLTAQTWPDVLKELFLLFEKQLEDLKEKVGQLASAVSHLHQVYKEINDPYPNEPDTFQWVNMVPSNPEHIVLDYDENSGTPKSALKKAIFDMNSTGVVTVIVSGMVGRGKTCALRGVGLDKQARSHFPGGVYYMSLGAESGKAELIRNIAIFVRRSGGYKKAKQVELTKNVAECVNIAAEWLRDRVCLMLIDDVWCTNGLGSSVAEELARLTNECTSRIALTTRDITLRGNVEIKFGKRDQSDSEKMLLCSAGLTEVPEDTNEATAMETVLNMAHGLPIALNVIGGRVRFLLKEANVNPSHIWMYVLKKYETLEALSELTYRDGQDKKMMDVLLLSLDMIDSATAEARSCDLFTDLSIIRKRQQVPSMS